MMRHAVVCKRCYRIVRVDEATALGAEAPLGGYYCADCWPRVERRIEGYVAESPRRDPLFWTPEREAFIKSCEPPVQMPPIPDVSQLLDAAKRGWRG